MKARIKDTWDALSQVRVRIAGVSRRSGDLSETLADLQDLDKYLHCANKIAKELMAAAPDGTVLNSLMMEAQDMGSGDMFTFSTCVQQRRVRAMVMEDLRTLNFSSMAHTLGSVAVDLDCADPEFCEMLIGQVLQKNLRNLPTGDVTGSVQAIVINIM